MTVYYNLILPIPITSFSATAIKNAVALKWQTPHPANDETFVVQRSADGNDWEALSGSIRHDQWLKQFEFIDNKPLAVSYYRIKTETRGGVTQYTDIRKHETSSFRKIIVYPNPAHNTINIQNAGASEIKLYNIAGQLVVKSQLLPAVNTIDITKLKPGIYFIVTGYNSQQILIQKDRM